MIQLPSRSLAPKILLAASSAVLATALGVVGYRAWTTPRVGVELVDRRAEVAELLALRAASTVDRGDSAGLPDPGDPPPLVREVIPVEIARLFFPLSGAGRPYDEKYYYARPPRVGWYTEWPEHPKGGYDLLTNGFGWREDTEPAAEAPDLRILVTGDSHTDGVCANSESFPNRLEALLAELDPTRSVEVLNAGIGGYTFWNYLGVLERYAPIVKPNVYVVACYGGNDFYEMLGPQRYFNKRKGGSNARLPEALLKAQGTGFVSQELLQVGHVLSNPEDEAIAVATANSIMREIKRVADEHGVRLIALYIPPPSIGSPLHTREELDPLLALTDWKREDLEISNRLADGWLGWCARHDIDCLDLRAAFREVEEPLYWEADRHINLRANDLIAALLSRFFDPATTR